MMSYPITTSMASTIIFTTVGHMDPTAETIVGSSGTHHCLPSKHVISKQVIQPPDQKREQTVALNNTPLGAIP